MLSPHHVRLWQSSLLISCRRRVLQIVLVDNVQLIAALRCVEHFRARIRVGMMMVHGVGWLRSTLAAVVARRHCFAINVIVITIVQVIDVVWSLTPLVILVVKNIVRV